VTVAGAISGAFMAGQLAHTIANKNNWPFASFNMFSFSTPRLPRRRLCILVGVDGHCVGPVPAWCLLPMEYFRVDAMIKSVFQAPRPERVRHDLAAAILRRVNTSPWEEWDEMRAAPRKCGADLVAIEFYLVQVDLRRANLEDPFDVVTAQVLFRHDPSGVLPRSTQYAELVSRWEAPCT
jgi:hypothetical protein